MVNTATIIVWKMKTGIAIGCSGQDIMMQLNRINGLFMASLPKM
jgi:hypothetical protein